jgi:hypothetical protein
LTALTEPTLLELSAAAVMRLLVQARAEEDEVVVVVVEAGEGEPLLEQALSTSAASRPLATRKGTVALGCMCPPRARLRLQP